MQLKKIKHSLLYLLTLSALLIFSGCGEKQEESSGTPGMKCGAGKCGANMFDSNSALAKKKRNILNQMRDNDSRKACVISAKTTKEVYNCVREPNGKKLSMKCGTGKCGDDNTQSSTMKCGAGKCGASMSETPKPVKEKEPAKKKEPAMKCGAGKCGSSMSAPVEKKVPKKEEVMKCGAGKCGS